MSDLLNTLKRFQELVEDKLSSDNLKIEQEEPLPPLPDPLPLLILQDRFGAFANLWMDYGEQGRVDFHTIAPFPGRLLDKERFWEKDLLETDFIRKQVESSYYYCPLDKVAKSLTFLLELGWTIIDHKGQKVVKQTPNSAQLFIDMQERDISVRGHINYDKHQVQLTDVLGAFNRRERFINLSEGVVGLIDLNDIEPFADLCDAEVTKEAILLKKSHVGLLESYLEMPSVTSHPSLKEFLERKEEQVALTSTFCGTLYPYQSQGVDFLLRLQRFGFHGLLADEMGLGKTVQILAFLSTCELKLPILIVAPTSLLFNWKLEIEKFLPTFSFYVHTGSKREQSQEHLQKQRCIITSYALLRGDAKLLQSISYACVILDEAQVIKNPESSVAQSAYKLHSALRLCITGTPIENSWEDLWSLFHFLEPSLLGTRLSFNAKMQAARVDARYIQQMKRKISPFLLRRCKDEVALELPEKQEQVVWVEMGEEQRGIYEEWVRKNRLGVLKKISQEGASAHRMEILEAILRLRQICCHPQLVDSSSGLPSAKCERVLEDIASIISHSKVIVYSQFTKMLQLIKKEVEARGWAYVYLDGSTKDRENVVKEFQEKKEVPLFLISLKAGGVGLNLTAADYVFLFDPWWNEAVEAQGIGRAHRVGRKKPVIARRYVTALSVEEKMMRLKEHKSLLSKGLFEGDLEGELSVEDLCELLE